MPILLELSVASDMMDLSFLKQSLPLAFRTLHSPGAPSTSLALFCLHDLHILECLPKVQCLDLFSFYTHSLGDLTVSLLYKLYADGVQIWIFRPEHRLLNPTSSTFPFGCLMNISNLNIPTIAPIPNPN